MPSELFLYGGLMIVVVAAALVGYAVLLAFTPARAEANEVSLVDAADAVLPPRTWAGRVDRTFQRMVRGSRLGVTSEGASIAILLAGALAATAVYLPTDDLLATGLAFLGGVLLSVSLFAVLEYRYRLAVQEQLPDGCYQLARSLRAGLTLETAMRTTAGYSANPLAEVFDRCASRMAMGLTPPAALRATADDLQLPDFESLYAVVQLHTRVGGNLPVLLDRLAASFRDRNQFRGYFRSATALSVLSAILIGLALPLAIVLYAVFYPEMFRNFLIVPGGPLLLLAAIVLWAVGIASVAWVIRRQSRY